MNAPGYFIVLEGGEGSGKSTLIAPLAERLRAMGIDPVVTREPGGTHAAEIARRALLDPDHPIGHWSELFFFLAARADLVERVIRPALQAGRVVLSDRFTPSTEAYQMVGRGLPAEVIRPANRAASGGLTPDLMLVLDLPADVGQARQIASGKRRDRLDQESPAFHQRVLEYYLALTGSGVRHLDGCLPPDRLLQAAWETILEEAPARFGGHSG